MNKTVSLWISDKQDAFVTGIAAEFPGVPHRYCDNHFLRDLAKPVLEADSHAKVQMRHKVRGAENRTSRAQTAECRGVDKPRTGRSHSNCDGDRAPANGLLPNPIRPAPWCSTIARLYVEFSITTREASPASGLLMAAALNEVRESIQRNLDAKKGGSQKSTRPSCRLHRRGLEHVQAEQRQSESTSRTSTRWPRPGIWRGELRAAEGEVQGVDRRFERNEDPIHQHMATLMISLAGLFVGAGKFEEIKDISILNDGFACPRVMSGGSTVVATRGFGSSKTGRR